MKLVRTTSDHPDFVELVKRLDGELAVLDGSQHSFYAQFNKIDRIKHAVVVYEGDTPAGCGAMKEFSVGTMEIKRMYVMPEHRRRGIARRVLSELESWAAELSYNHCVLETGKRQPEAIALYQQAGYHSIPNYGQYAGVENSVCFEKMLGRRSTGIAPRRGYRY